MIKELMKSIFNEDVDLEEEFEEEFDEVEELEEEPFVQEQEQIPTMDVVQPVQPTMVQTPIQPTVQTVAQPSVVHSESFADLSIDDITSPEADILRPRPYKYDRKKLNKIGKRTQPDEEYSAVISPIFGNTNEEEKDYKKIHNAINLEKPVDDPEFVQVISPMFGNNVAGNIPVQSIPKKDPDLNLSKKKQNIQSKEVTVSKVVETKEPEVVQTKLFSTKD